MVTKSAPTVIKWQSNGKVSLHQSLHTISDLVFSHKTSKSAENDSPNVRRGNISLEPKHKKRSNDALPTRDQGRETKRRKTSKRDPARKPKDGSPRARRRRDNNALSRHSRLHTQPSPVRVPDPRSPGVHLQPEPRELTQEQLAAEVKFIYSRLWIVEANCIHIVAAQSKAFKEGEAVQVDWQALMASHRTLLHEHHDFLLASQDVSAPPALKRLAVKCSMPERMWKHGIYSFLELLRCRLPQSCQHMRTFIYFAYHMMAFLFERVPSFEDTWIESLGDLARYRMAIEDDDQRERDLWAGISHYWYRMAADRSPGVGRLYHHMAVLARRDPFHQIYYYCRSFTSKKLFPTARESILAVFRPVHNRSSASPPISRPNEFYVKMHAMIFFKQHLEDFDASQRTFLKLLPDHINRLGANWRELGAWLAISNIGALFEHGSNTAVLRGLFEHLAFRDKHAESTGSESVKSVPSRGSPTPASSADFGLSEHDRISRLAFDNALKMTVSVAELVLGWADDRNVRPHVHILLSFILVLSDIQLYGNQTQREYVLEILDGMPWKDIASFVTTLANSGEFGTQYETEDFLQPEPGDAYPLPEDYLLRGLIWTHKLFPDGWWRDGEIDPAEQLFERASTVRKTGERILNLAYRLAKVGLPRND